MADDGFFYEELPDGPATAELRDPGLHPRFQLFISNLMTGYLSVAPNRVNALVSAYHLLASDSKADAVVRDLVNARAVFLDSGCISTLLACLAGNLPAAAVHEWLKRTPDVLALAWQLHDQGVGPGVVAAMDLPAYAGMLDAAGITVDAAEQITLANAQLMMASELPPGWRAVYTSQGVSLADHERCLAGYEDLGVLAAVRRGEAWLAVGGMAFEDSDNRVHVIHEAVRDTLGPGHIHALGVTRLPTLVPMMRNGWVDSADSSSTAQEVRYNRGPYQVRGPRPTFLADALHAAAALNAEAELAAALRKAAAVPAYRQEVLL